MDQISGGGHASGWCETRAGSVAYVFEEQEEPLGVSGNDVMQAVAVPIDDVRYDQSAAKKLGGNLLDFSGRFVGDVTRFGALG